MCGSLDFCEHYNLSGARSPYCILTGTTSKISSKRRNDWNFFPWREIVSVDTQFSCSLAFVLVTLSLLFLFILVSIFRILVFIIFTPLFFTSLFFTSLFFTSPFFTSLFTLLFTFALLATSILGPELFVGVSTIGVRPPDLGVGTP
ncbi:hypothetical protein AG1IA_05796 [Rhizoctonia solani AG-1 IA]|uniref:Uncharacterized protein n=1 Tax=Thanatephorus cucumeris (strain AG1-IA) TaxID=983506 RepID=L8WUZ9_THACA|nr:hypothetical protein AG1IA_05796 [Rhizoctonia solani AG-1 IA]